MIVRFIVAAAAAALALSGPAAALEEPTQAVRLCEDVMLYAGEPEEGGLWREIRIEDARAGGTNVYTARSAQFGDLRGTPSVLLLDGQVRTSSGQTLVFDEFVLRSCPEASLHLIH